MNLLAIKQLVDQIGDIEPLMPRQAQNQLLNLTALHALVDKSRPVPGAETIIQRIDQLPPYRANAQAVALDDNARALFREAEALKNYLKAIQLLASSVSTKESNSADVFVRFPKAGDLPALTQQLGTFQKILEQTILEPKIAGKMEVKAVDSGSVIIQLYLGSVAAVGLVGSLAWAAVVVYKKYQEAMLVKNHVEALEIRNDALREIKDAQEQMLKNIVTAEARHLEKEVFGGEEVPERLERIKHSIEMFQDLLEKGAEVHPALMAPEQVKNVFPDFLKLGSVESKIKKIADKVSA